MIIISFTVLNLLLTTFLIPLSITLVTIFNNYIVSLVITIGITMVSLILIPAPFSNLIPTTLSYRVGLDIIDSSMGFESSNDIIVGIMLLIIISIIFIFTGVRNLKIR